MFCKALVVLEEGRLVRVVVINSERMEESAGGKSMRF